MKVLIAVFMSLVLSLDEVKAQYFLSDFEDGTEQGWTGELNHPNPPFATPGTTPSGSFCLEVRSSGLIGPGGSWMIMNIEDEWQGNYIPENTYFSFCFRNYLEHELKLRLGIRGGDDDTIIVEINPQNIPGQFGWHCFGDSLNETTDFVVISGNSSVTEVLEDVKEIRLFHNAEILFEGEPVETISEIDDIFIESALNYKERIKDYVELVTNIVDDELLIKSFEKFEDYRIVDLSGRIIQSGRIERNQIDVSQLSSGMFVLILNNRSTYHDLKFLRK